MKKVPYDCPFVGMTRMPSLPIITAYVGPKHVPAVPKAQRGYMPDSVLLRRLGFVEVVGFTGWLRRDEARPIGYFWLQGKRYPAPNFQKIACWGRFTGTPGRLDDDWRLIDDLDFTDELRVPAPRNDEEFKALVARFSPVTVDRLSYPPTRNRIRQRLITAKKHVDWGRWWGLKS